MNGITDFNLFVLGNNFQQIGEFEKRAVFRAILNKRNSQSVCSKIVLQIFIFLYYFTKLKISNTNLKLEITLFFWGLFLIKSNFLRSFDLILSKM